MEIKEILEFLDNTKVLDRKSIKRLAELIKSCSKKFFYKDRVEEYNKILEQLQNIYKTNFGRFETWKERKSSTYYGSMGKWRMGRKYGGDCYMSTGTNSHTLRIVVWKGSKHLLKKELERR